MGILAKAPGSAARVRVPPQWLRRWAFSALIVVGLPVLASTQEVRVLDSKVISQQPQYFLGWPTVLRRSNGHLLVAFSGGRDYHVCPFGRIEVMSSRDDGDNWTASRVLSDSAIDDRDSGLLETRKGSLLVTYFSAYSYQKLLRKPEKSLLRALGADAENVLKRWKLMDEATGDAQKKADQGFWMLRSTDAGMNWSPRYRVPGYAPHGPVNLDDGRLFYAAADGKQSVALISEDDGLTWNVASRLPARAGEMTAVQAENGDLVVQVREKISTPKGVAQHTAQTVSSDGGKTWTSVRKVADGFPSHLLRTRNGALLMIYGWRWKPYGIRGKISRDHGKSWSHEFILVDNGESADLGYPSTVELPGNRFLTVWYEAPGNSAKAVLKQTRWELDD